MRHEAVINCAAHQIDNEVGMRAVTRMFNLKEVFQLVKNGFNLVCEARSNGERKYYFTNHSPNTPPKTLVRAIKAHWSCEQAHRQLKEELGLDHYEGRSWLGHMAAARSPPLSGPMNRKFLHPRQHPRSAFSAMLLSISTMPSPQ
jgi:SRSO17 transposase